MLQKLMETVLISGLVIFSLAAIVIGGSPKPASGGASGSFGFAMIFVLLAYGGRDEPPHPPGALRDARRNMTVILARGAIADTSPFLPVNLGLRPLASH